MENCTVKDITFEGCTFNDTEDDGKNAAIKFLADNQYFTDITVKDCEISDYCQGVYIQGVDGAEISNNSISNTVHNAITLQSHTVAAKGTIEVAENYISNVTERTIRLNAVSADAEVYVNNNIMVNCGDDEGQLIKTGSVDNGAIIDLESNYWDGKDVSTAISGLTAPTTVGITGGVWNQDVSDCLAEGYKVENGNVVSSALPDIDLPGALLGAIILTDTTTATMMPEKDVLTLGDALEMHQLQLASGGFTDVSRSDRFYGDITALVNKGIINGYPDGSFKPFGEATWGEALKLAPAGIEYPFDDAAPEAAVALYATGIINGSLDNGQLLFRGESTIIRAEMAAIIWRVYCAR